jgi:hypothetical protein
MNVVQPTNFLEFTGSLLLLVAVVFAILSLVQRIRQASLRLSAINFLGAFAVLSNYWVTYFAAIFIVATAVTELEFLHILAAIIRGDKNYFDFRREFLTRDEVLRKARLDEVTEPALTKNEQADKSTSKSSVNVAKPKGSNPLNAFHVEERALDWLEKRHSFSVTRYVRFSIGQNTVEVDGIIQGKPSEPDTLIEVKWLRSEPPGTGAFGRIVDQVSQLVLRYKEITKRNAELVLLLVVPKGLPQAMTDQMTARFHDHGVKALIVEVTYNELSVSDPDGTEQA